MPQADYWALLGQPTYLRLAVLGVQPDLGGRGHGDAEAPDAPHGIVVKSNRSKWKAL